MSGISKLLNIASIILVLAHAGGCCLTDVPEETESLKVMGTFKGEELDELRAGMLTDEERCEAACMRLGSATGTRLDRIESCVATGNVVGGDGDGDSNDVSPWDLVQVEVSVICRVATTSAGVCT